MSTYRLYRNIEATLVDWVAAQLTADSWSGIRTEKAFSKVYEGTLPVILIQHQDTRRTKKEIGNSSYIKYPAIYFRIFASDDGQREDLSSWLGDKLENTIDYYTYVITNGVAVKTKAGKINFTKFLTDRKELINTENLDKKDKFRHLLAVEVKVDLT